MILLSFAEAFFDMNKHYGKETYNKTVVLTIVVAMAVTMYQGEDYYAIEWFQQVEDNDRLFFL